MNALRTVHLVGKEIQQILPELGALRIQVFRDFPYLYEGNLAYEENYLQIYTSSEESIVVGIYDDNRLIGATSGIPLMQETTEIQKAFISTNISVETVFYFGESIILPAYRGKGLGHLFFDKREQHALKLGYTTTAFCSVIRPEKHPLKPVNYRDNSVFWSKRNYLPQDGMICQMSWLDRGETEETVKDLQFWIKKWK